MVPRGERPTATTECLADDTSGRYVKSRTSAGAGRCRRRYLSSFQRPEGVVTAFGIDRRLYAFRESRTTKGQVQWRTTVHLALQCNEILDLAT